jgi:hypothetical protein
MTEDTEETGYDPIAIARRNPQSKKKAITAFCCTCMGGVVPGWKGEIRNCTAPGCPLYPHRPYQAIRSEIVAI